MFSCRVIGEMDIISQQLENLLSGRRQPVYVGAREVMCACKVLAHRRKVTEGDDIEHLACRLFVQDCETPGGGYIVCEESTYLLTEKLRRSPEPFSGLGIMKRDFMQAKQGAKLIPGEIRGIGGDGYVRMSGP